MSPMFSHTWTDRREAVSEVSAMSAVAISVLPTKPDMENVAREFVLCFLLLLMPLSLVLLLMKQALGSSWLEMAMKSSQISRQHCLST